MCFSCDHDGSCQIIELAKRGRIKIRKSVVMFDSVRVNSLKPSEKLMCKLMPPNEFVLQDGRSLLYAATGCTVVWPVWFTA